jgi:hypothetical protein
MIMYSFAAIDDHFNWLFFRFLEIQPIRNKVQKIYFLIGCINFCRTSLCKMQKWKPVKNTVLHQIMLTSIIDHCFCFENFSQSGKKTLKLNFTISISQLDLANQKIVCIFSVWLKFSKQKQWSIINVSIIWCNTVGSWFGLWVFKIFYKCFGSGFWVSIFSKILGFVLRFWNRFGFGLHLCVKWDIFA